MSGNGLPLGNGSMPGHLPADIAAQHVPCPGCHRTATRGHFRTGEPRMCVGCGAIYLQPPWGWRAERGTVEAFNKAASRGEREVYLS